MKRDLSAFVEVTPSNIPENLAVSYLAGGIAQAMSPMKSIDLDHLNPSYAPFRRETRLSQMKKILKKNDHYYK